MTTKSIASATVGQKKQLVRLVEEVGESALAELGLNKEDAQRLLGKGGSFKSRLHGLLTPLVREISSAPNIVVVPDMPAFDLTAAAMRDLRLTSLEDDFAEWNYYRDVDDNRIAGRGQTFEAFVWQPKFDRKKLISPEKAREYLHERGYMGHVGAFIQWRRQNPNLMGYHTTIPENPACFIFHDSLLYVPVSYFDDDGQRTLGRCCRVVGVWGVPWSFVGFRLIS